MKKTLNYVILGAVVGVLCVALVVTDAMTTGRGVTANGTTESTVPQTQYWYEHEYGYEYEDVYEDEYTGEHKTGSDRLGVSGSVQVAEYDGDVYFAVDGKICKAGAGADEYEFLCSVDGVYAGKRDFEVECINVYDGWVYYNFRRHYSNGSWYGTDVEWYTYKVRTDGTDQTEIKNVRGEFLVYDDRIYYRDDNDVLCSVDLDGYVKRRVINCMGEGFTADGDYIYYMDFLENGVRKVLYRVKKDGSGKECIYSDAVRAFIIRDGYIYFEDTGYNLCRMNTDGSGAEQWYDGSASLCDVRDGNMYFHSLKEGEIYMINEPSGEAAEVMKGTDAIPMVIDGYAYYLSDSALERVKADGSGERTVIEILPEDYE